MRPSLLAAAVVLALAGCAARGATSAATVEVKDAWIRTPPPGAPTAAAYATITNHAIATDRLTGAYTSVAASVGLHEMTRQGGVMHMQAIAGGLPISSSGAVKLEPNGRHLMLTGLKRPLKAGQHVRIVLQFQRAGQIPTDFVVRDDAGGMGGMRM
jgi:periplasmic copper chaperone A